MTFLYKTYKQVVLFFKSRIPQKNGPVRLRTIHTRQMWVERQRNNNLLLLKISWQLALKKVFVVCHTTFAPKVKNILWIIIFEKKPKERYPYYSANLEQHSAARQDWLIRLRTCPNKRDSNGSSDYQRICLRLWNFSKRLFCCHRPMRHGRNECAVVQGRGEGGTVESMRCVVHGWLNLTLLIIVTGSWEISTILDDPSGSQRCLQ